MFDLGIRRVHARRRGWGAYWTIQFRCGCLVFRTAWGHPARPGPDLCGDHILIIYRNAKAIGWPRESRFWPV